MSYIEFHKRGALKALAQHDPVHVTQKDHDAAVAQLRRAGHYTPQRGQILHSMTQQAIQKRLAAEKEVERYERIEKLKMALQQRR